MLLPYCPWGLALVFGFACSANNDDGDKDRGGRDRGNGEHWGEDTGDQDNTDTGTPL